MSFFGCFLSSLELEQTKVHPQSQMEEIFLTVVDQPVKCMMV